MKIIYQPRLYDPVNTGFINGQLYIGINDIRSMAPIVYIFSCGDLVSLHGNLVIPAGTNGRKPKNYVNVTDRFTLVENPISQE